jgi:hypothetical protein
MDPARGTKDETETARPCPPGGQRSRTQRGRGPRYLLALGAAALLVALPAASAPAVGSLISAGAAASSVAPAGRLSVVDAPAIASRTSAPALLAKKPPRRHSDRARIGAFTAIPATLPSAGGTVHLFAVVASATTCRFSASKALKPLPATERCSSGRVSIEVKLPKNPTASTRTYDFQLVVSGSHGASTAAPVAVVERASVAATTAPSITTQPASRSVIAGSTVTFTAAAARAASVQWEVSTGPGGWSDIAGATDDSYSFVAALGESGYQYRAVFSGHGHSTVSEAATLTVSAGSGNPAQGGQGVVSGADASEAPIVTLQPVGDGVVTQTTATFTAQASGAPAPSVQWQRLTPGTTTWVAIAGATSTTYSFTATVSDNGDEYRAVFTNSAGTATTIAASLDVVLERVPPNVTTEPQSQSVVIGEPVTFTAAASAGVPAATVQWEMSVDSGATWSLIDGATSTTYSFVAATGQNGYEYRAQFINGDALEAVDTEAAILTVSEPELPLVTANPIPYPVVAPAYVGTTASFTATASGLPAPTVQWEVSTTGAGGIYTAIPGATSTTYAFDPTLAQSGDYYEAVFSNLAGTATSAPALLTVVVPLVAPTITEQPVSQAVVDGGSATFSAAAGGNPTPTVAWQVSTDGGDTWGAVSGANSSSYGLFATTSGESGWQYRAVFTNSQGSATTDAVTLTVGSDGQTTYNWSGYAAMGAVGEFNQVTGDWTVPTASCPTGATTYSSEWIGIDGATSPSVEQDGTDSDCASGAPSYYAWYELFPAASITIPSATYPVSHGDSMSASVSFSGIDWTLQISDLTAGWNFSFAQAESALDQNSAEWIAERPELCSGDCSNPADVTLTSLADFGSVSFSNATANGESLSALSPTSIQMTSKNSSALLALAGPLSGSGFTDTWYGNN